MPTPFDGDGLVGGGERYPVEPAHALAADVDCEPVTFGRRACRAAGGLRVHVLRAVTHLRQHPAHPVAPALPAALPGADSVHTHHLRSTPTRIAGVTARLSRQRPAVTDHVRRRRGHDPRAGDVDELRDRTATVVGSPRLAAPMGRAAREACATTGGSCAGTGPAGGPRTHPLAVARADGVHRAAAAPYAFR